MLKQKIKKLQNFIRSQNLDAVILGNFNHQINDDQLYWLLLKKLESALMHIPAKGRPVLYVIPFEAGQLKQIYKEINVRPFNKPLENAITVCLKDQIKMVGFRHSALPASVRDRIKKIKICRIKELVGDHKITAVKIPEEIKRIKKACEITDNIFKKLIKSWQSFYTEKDAVHFLLAQITARGLEPSFSPIVASGKNASNPHHNIFDQKIQPGFCVIDFGVRYKGYCSDMTRTIYIGHPVPAELYIYSRLLDAQIKTLNQTAPEASTAELDKFCRKKLGKELDKQFIHALGHGVGTQVHEWPRITKKEEIILKENMVIAIEPGIYKKNEYGIRIEDTVLVTKTGHEVLNCSDKELIVV